MDSAAQIALAEQIFKHLDAGTTSMSEDLTRIPVQTYCCPDRLRRERSILFRRYPLVAGLSCQLPEPGDYLTTDYLGPPFLLVRGEDRRVRAFLNVCRHRGARVARDCGHIQRVFSCPYHGWSYGLDGALAHVPHEAAFDGVDRAARGLKAVEVEERHGMIWVLPAGAADLDVDAHLGGLGLELESYRLDEYHLYESRVIEPRLNWKIAIDGFLEPYHFGVLHRQTVGPLLVHDLGVFQPFGPNLRQVYPRPTIEEARAQPLSDLRLIEHTTIVYVLFPNTLLVMQQDHVELWRVYPAEGRVDRCVMTVDVLIPEPAATDEARGHWDRNVDLLMRTVLEEDLPAGVSIQAGLDSGAQDDLLVGRNEPAVAHFENAVTAAIAD